MSGEGLPGLTSLKHSLSAYPEYNAVSGSEGVMKYAANVFGVHKPRSGDN